MDLAEKSNFISSTNAIIPFICIFWVIFKSFNPKKVEFVSLVHQTCRGRAISTFPLSNLLTPSQLANYFISPAS